MAAPASPSLGVVFRDVVGCLEQRRIPYLVIGGIAQAVIGEPRLTQDVDCIVFVPPADANTVLDAFQQAGFAVDTASAMAQIETTGTFAVTRDRWRVDCILASTDFEQSALQRRQRLRLYDVEANLPTPEDLVLLKLVPGRDKDLLDIKTILLRHHATLDVAYLTHWARRLADEAEDARMRRTLQQLLRDVGLRT